MEFTIADIAALMTVIVGLYLAKSTRNKAKTDAALAISEAAANIVKIRECDIQQLNARYKLLRSYVEYLTDGVLVLTKQLKKEGITPEFVPKSFDTYKEAKQNEAKV